MGIRRSWSEVEERDSSGNNDFLNLVSLGVRKTACILWESAPDLITKNKNLPGSMIRGFMNNTCSPEPVTLPPAPTVPFTGGQCPSTIYNVGITLSHSGGTNENFGMGQAKGPLTNPRVNIGAPNGGSQGWDIRLDGVNEVTGQPKELVSLGSRPAPVTFVSWNISVFSGSDNCGDPPTQYPSSGFDPSTFSDTVDVDSGDGFMLAIPIVLINNELNFPIEFDLGGINVNLDLGGIHFEFGDTTITNEPLPLPTEEQHPLPAPNDDSKRNTCTKLLPSPDDVLPFNLPSPYNETIKLPTDPKEETITNKVKFIRITITQMPANARSVTGLGAPDVIYAGWFMWKVDDFVMSRQFISFEQSTFIAPEGANGYAYTLLLGYTGFATIYELDV